MTQIPYFITYPRSGCHWLNAMFELYFDRIRGPRGEGALEKNNISWVKRKNPTEEYMWFHSHDKNLDIIPSESIYGDIFLFRNPVHCIYSLSRIETEKQNKDRILQEAIYYKNLFEKWINISKTVLIYEFAVKDPYKSIMIMSNHFNIPYNLQRAELAVNTCTKEAIMGFQYKYHNKSVLTEDYKANRIKFEKEYSKDIYDIVLTDTIKPLLEKII